jgi:arylsulfatase A-like enzyme
LRIEGTNLDEARADDDRYARYNNLYRILGKAGVNRWCHADTSPYFQLLVPGAMRDNEDTAWKTEETFDSGVTAEEEERGISRGDKRNQRMLEFLDDLKPGDKFFMCEHMSDTHFDWERTSLKRAKELGFKDGLVPYEADGLLPRTGKQNETYSCYFHTITRMDAQIGQILKKLDELDLYDETMIVVISDHGCQFWEHEHLYYVSHLYEQSLQVPLIIKTPGLPGGLVSDAPVMQMDLMPTVMELAGMRQANPREEDPWMCRSLAPLMRGDESAETVTQYRRRDIPLTTHHDMLGVISEFRHKLIFERPSGTYLLFDLVDDPDEMHNLVDTRPELLEAMMVKLRALIARNPSFIWRIKSPSEQ